MIAGSFAAVVDLVTPWLRDSFAAHNSAVIEDLKQDAVCGLAEGIAPDINNLLQVISRNLQSALRDMPLEFPVRTWLDQSMRSVKWRAPLASQVRNQPIVPELINH